MTTHQARPAVSQPHYAAAVPTHGAPAGTFVPGTKVQVGSHRVVVTKYLSEGGFAHVYVVKLPSPENASAVLKRVAVPDKDTLANMRNEVETMKKLRGHKHIVTYIDSHASQLKGGGYEVFLLMEYCSGGGLIDFMNTRLKNRLTEPEIIDIIADTAEGVAHMHYLESPLLHRDLKVENILISQTSDGRKRYKLCDFGSAAPPRPAAKTAAEGRLIEDDVQRHTTLQYRSPEMIDVYRHKPIDEKSDVWALGVLLYKLCYYTTPFEEQGQMAILSASFKYPAYPPFSDSLKKLIAMMLMEDPSHRPNIYQIVRDLSALRGRECPIKDIYANRTQSKARSTQQLPPREADISSPPTVGARLEAPHQAKQYVPEVTPMRRGRPVISTPHNVTRPSPSPNEGSRADPFAALDSKKYDERAQAIETLSEKYPALDDFASLQNKGKFEFDGGTTKAPSKPPAVPDTNQRVANALADEAFAKTRAAPEPVPRPRSEAPPRTTSLAKPTVEHADTKLSSAQSIAQPQLPRPSMVSTGTMTSPPSSPKNSTPPQPPKPSLEVWRVPSRGGHASPRLSSIARFDDMAAKHPVVRDLSRSPNPNMPMSPASSRPSLEGGRPTLDASSDLYRSRSINSPEQQHHRRGSLFRRVSSKKETSHRSSMYESPTPSSPTVNDDTNIVSDVDYLRAIEAENNAAVKASHHRRSSSTIRNIKHASLPSFGGAKQKFAGKLGDTFKRFDEKRYTAPREDTVTQMASMVTPLASQADDEGDLLSTSPPYGVRDLSLTEERVDIIEDVPPEMRRELERRQLEAEERRVEDAAAAYRQHLAGGKGQPSARASAIQNRVRSLLDESERSSPVKKTAEGYGRYTDRSASDEDGSRDENELRNFEPQAPIHKSHSIASANPMRRPHLTAKAAADKPLPPKPNIAPKPVALRTGGPPVPAKPAIDTQCAAGSKTATPNLMDSSPDQISGDGVVQNFIDDSPGWEASFAKKYPRLSLELVEADITAPRGGLSQDRTAPEVQVGSSRAKDS